MPVYNEEQVIESTVLGWLEALRAVKSTFSLQVYNDGSRDGSLSVLTRLAADNSELSVHDKENSGHGPTILAGYRENSEAEWIFQTDSDQELSPGDFSKLWDRRRDFDFLIGRRHQRRQPPGRRLLSMLSRAAVRWLYGRGLFDVNSPYRLMRAAAFAPYFDLLPDDTFAPNVILSGVACRQGLRIIEVSIPHSAAHAGRSGFDASLLKLAATALRSFKQTLDFRRRYGG